ncbi:MAG: Mpo1-like protein [Gammaproteobacteria bacterium]
MKPVQQWLDEYGESHQNPTNKIIHWICVPVIALSLIGLLWALPVPAAFVDISPTLNWGVLFMMAAIVYYFILSAKLALGMIGVMALFTVTLIWLDSLPLPLWAICVAVFVLAWIGQFVGHMIEGKRPSFFQDLQFLMIGPMWLLSFVYQRLGVRY